MVDIAIVAQYLINGLSVGAIYALVALGLTLVFGVMDILNLAHGEYVMLGAYTSWIVVEQSPLGYFVAIPIAMVVVGIIAIISNELVFKPLEDKTALDKLLGAIGLVFLFQSAMMLAFGNTPKAIQSPFELATVDIGVIFIPYFRIFVVVLAILLFVGLWVFMNYTKIGLGMRAMSMDRDTAMIRGVDPDRVGRATFGVSGVLAGAAGAILIGLFSAAPQIGLVYLLKAFAVIILGGLGSIGGTLVGGAVIGGFENLLAGMVNASYRHGYAYALLLFVLIVRPQGIFKGWQR